MAQFVAFEKDVEVLGQTIMAIKKGLGLFSQTADEIFEEHDLINIKFDSWYPQQKWLDCFKQIAEEMGEKTLFQIGIKIPDSAIFPPEINDVHKALQSIDIAYHMNHKLRGLVLFDSSSGKMREGIGHYNYEMVNPKSAKITCINPYPCAFDKGIIFSMARKFSTNSIIEHIAGDCRNRGNDKCEYSITW